MKQPQFEFLTAQWQCLHCRNFFVQRENGTPVLCPVCDPPTEAGAGAGVGGLAAFRARTRELHQEEAERERKAPLAMLVRCGGCHGVLLVERARVRNQPNPDPDHEHHLLIFAVTATGAVRSTRMQCPYGCSDDDHMGLSEMLLERFDQHATPADLLRAGQRAAQEARKTRGPSERSH